MSDNHNRGPQGAMDIVALNQMFQKGSYQDYTLAEYQFLRRFMGLTKPDTITCVGGYSNLDLFYSCQEIAPRVINWDSGAHLLGLPMSTLRESHDLYRDLTGFKGTYDWVSQTVNDLRMVGQQDLLWLGGLQDDVYEIEQWPKHMIFGHHGKMKWAQAMRHVHDHLPLVAMGRNIAVFSRDSWHNWSHHTYVTVKSDFMDITDVPEIVS